MLPSPRPTQTTPPNPPEALPPSAGGTPILQPAVQFTPQQPAPNSYSLPPPQTQPQQPAPLAPPPTHPQPIPVQNQQHQHQHQHQHQQQYLQNHHHHHHQSQQQIPRSTSAPRFSHRRRGADSALSSEGGVRARHPSHSQTPSGGSIPVPPLPGNSPQGVQRRQGKQPIFEWFKGKLGARRGSDADQHRRDAAIAAANTAGGNGNNNGKRVLSGKALPPTPIIHLGYRQDIPLSPPGPLSPNSIMTRNSEESGTAFRRTESMSVRSHSMSSSYIPTERRRELNNPYPSLPIPLVRRSYPASTIDTESRHASMSVLTRSRTSSLGSLSSHPRRPQISIADHSSTHESLTNSASGLCADDDASVRPLPPSPSRSMSIISRFGSEALAHSDSFTRRVPTSPPPPDRRDTYSSVGAATSITSDDMGGRSRQNSLASTKPTTVMSFDSNGPPVAHIAVAATTSTSSSPIVIPATSPPGPSAAPSLSSPVSATFPPPPGPPPDEVRVPRHTRYHPRNNPHPSSPPAPDASTVTLASSTFALGTDRAQRPNSTRSPAAVLQGTSPASHNPVSPSVAFADAPGSMYDGVSTHALSFNARSRGYGRCDDDASMRAVRRRGSWESAESRWSWRPGTESAGVFAALGRGSVSHADVTEETAAPATNRSSTQTRESFRTAYSTWTQAEPESGEHTLTSEPSLVSHRPVSVRV